ncbi:hypothetical protein B2J93_3336 [Marssonina coronariae]|uniref:6-methylsalicylate decarboxylase n=1 Tax=Diplocarpon coronariae TaxID=2795749 RepID=A0A218ZD40_9HELO|nr:hypothetical protein B2J93_3336 [Marssonina coronariae]
MALLTSARPLAERSTGRIDTHIHAIPLSFSNILTAAGQTDMPGWSLAATREFMAAANISIAILSISTPGVSILGTGQEARDLARSLNTELGSYVTLPHLTRPISGSRNSTASPDSNSTSTASLGFFGTLPDWQDVDGVLAELDFLFTEQKLCSGVAIYTSYGSKLLGDPVYAPIWAKLQQYKALIFIHPSGLDVTPELIGPGLPQFVIDFLWATTRTATDLVMTGTLSAAPDVDVILAHAGGALPYTASRALASLLAPPIASIVPITAQEAVAQFARFHYDLALSTSSAQLDGLLDFSDEIHVGFGSDYPYAPSDVVELISSYLTRFQVSNARGEQLGEPVLRQSSLELLNKHAIGRVWT